MSGDLRYWCRDTRTPVLQSWPAWVKISPKHSKDPQRRPALLREYTGAELRAMRAVRGVGRPPR